MYLGFYHTKDGCDCVAAWPYGCKKWKRTAPSTSNNGVYLAGSEIKFEQLSGIVAGRQKPFSNAYATVWDDQYFGLSLFEKDRAKQTAQSEDEQVLEISLRKNFKRWKFAVRLIAKKQTK